MWYHVAYPYLVQHYNTGPGLPALPSYIMFINTQEAKINMSSMSLKNTHNDTVFQWAKYVTSHAQTYANGFPLNS